MPGHTSGKGTSCLKHILADDLQLFLQSRKNSLRSAVVLHLIEESDLGDFLKKFLSVFHYVLS